MEVQLGEKTLGQHGSNIYYKEFFVTTKSETKCYRPGRFYFVQKSDDYPITIAEFQLIWHSLKDEKNYASVKLYFKPEGGYDENEPFGKDEVLEASRQVVIECSKFPSWECTSDSWYEDVGETVYNGVQLEKLKSLNRDQHTITQKNAKSLKKIKIISFPQYCRYKTCLKMLKLGVPMTYFELLSRGGLDINNLNTIILFSKKQFEKDDVEDYSPTENISVPVFKGRPRKRKNNETAKASKKKAKIEKNNSILPLNSSDAIDTKCVKNEKDCASTKTLTPKGSVRGRDTVSHVKREMTMKNKEEHEEFSKSLHEFMERNGTPIIKIPRIGCAPVDPLVLFRSVMERGGYNQVTLNRQWRNVYDCLGHSTMITNAATATRKSYERMLLPYENYQQKVSDEKTNNKEKKQSNISPLRVRKDSDTIKPREKEIPKIPTQEEFHPTPFKEIVIASASDSDESNPESLSISLMMSKQRGRPSKKFRNQIEKLRTKQNMKLKEEMNNSIGTNPIHQTRDVRSGNINLNNKQYKHYPRKQTWVNELNVDIVNASRKSIDVPRTSPMIRKEKDQQNERKSNGSVSDAELISPRRIEVHSPLRQGRRLYSSSKDSSIVNENFVPIVPRPVKPKPQLAPNPHKEFCEFKIQSVRSLAESEEQKHHQLPPSSKNNVVQYMHYPYSSAGYEFIPNSRQYYSLSDGNKLIPVTLPEHHRNTNKGTFRDSGFSMRTFRNEHQSPENNSYKIKSSALKNHEPYIIHHPSHVNRAYGGIPGQYPVLYTHHPGRYPGKSHRTSFQPENPAVHRSARFISSAQFDMRDFNHPANGYICEQVSQRYEKISPRVEKISPRIDRISPCGNTRPGGPPGYLHYIEESTTKGRPLPVVSVSCTM